MAAKPDPFVADLLDRLEGVGGVTARSMFGGHGLYQGGEIFACVDNGEVFLKCDERTLKNFQALGSRPFQPMGKKGPTMSKYWLVPADVLDDRHEFVQAVRSVLKARTAP